MAVGWAGLQTLQLQTLQLIKVKEYAILLPVMVDILCCYAPSGIQAGTGDCKQKKIANVASGATGSLDSKYPTAFLLIDQEEV